MAASQAATVRMKITRIWPPQSLWYRPQATKLTETPCSIISAARNMTIMFRRLKNPTRPMPNKQRPDDQIVLKQGDLIHGTSWARFDRRAAGHPLAGRPIDDPRIEPGCAAWQPAGICSDASARIATAPTSATSSSVPADFDREQIAAEQLAPEWAMCCGGSTPLLELLGRRSGHRRGGFAPSRKTPTTASVITPTSTMPASDGPGACPSSAIVKAPARRLGQHQHEQKRDQNRAGIDDHRRHAQKLSPLKQKQAGRAQQRQGEPDGTVNRTAKRDGGRGRDDGHRGHDVKDDVAGPSPNGGHLRGQHTQARPAPTAPPSSRPLAARRAATSATCRQRHSSGGQRPMRVGWLDHRCASELDCDFIGSASLVWS